MKSFFDLLITILLSITALPAVILLYSRKKRKNSWEYKYQKISLAIASFLLLGTMTVSYGSFIEPQLLVTTKYEIDLPEIEEPIKIAFIADLQLGKYKGGVWMKKVADKTLKLNPDLILLGGDQIDNENYDFAELEYLQPLEKLAKQIPTYAVHGNHEYGVSCYYGINETCAQAGDMSKETREAMENLGVIYLVNNLEKITVNSSSFYLFGGDSYWTKKLNYSVLAEKTDNIPTIALIHNPAFIFNKFPKFDLVLSGHTHGGQVRLPFIGPVARVDNILSSKHYQGLHNLNTNTKLLVTSGAGETGTRARLFNPPEIILLTIK